MSSNEYQHWNDPGVVAALRSRQVGITDYAYEVEARIPRQSRILELGCGAGDDAGFFAKQGHDVIAVDFSVPLIDIAAERYADLPNLEFRVADMTQSFNVSGQSLDVVYARLSIQYFDYKATLGIFSEIAWVLRSGGQLYFACRSTEDPLFGKGVELAPDFFELDGHMRRFFDTEMVRELLEVNGFTKLEMSAGKQKLYGESSAYIKCFAVKP